MSAPRIPRCWLACYSQPMEDLPKWVNRGCNLAVHSELRNGTVSQSAWRAAARAAGLPYIDTFLDQRDVEDPWLIGWVIKDSDEWNRKRGNTYPDTAPMIAQAQMLAQLNATAGTKKLILANADGMAATSAYGAYNGVANGEKKLLPYLTALCSDWYPVMNTVPGEEYRRPLYLPAQAVERLRTWAADVKAKPVMDFAFLEGAKRFDAKLSITGPQMLDIAYYLTGGSFPGPNAQDTKLDPVGGLILWSANGQNGPGWKWDVMNQEQIDAWTTICKRLDPDNPLWRPAPPPADDLAKRVAAMEGTVMDHTLQIEALRKLMDQLKQTDEAINGTAAAALAAAQKAQLSAEAAGSMGADALARIRRMVEAGA